MQDMGFTEANLKAREPSFRHKSGIKLSALSRASYWYWVGGKPDWPPSPTGL